MGIRRWRGAKAGLYTPDRPLSLAETGETGLNLRKPCFDYSLIRAKLDLAFEYLFNKGNYIGR